MRIIALLLSSALLIGACAPQKKDQSSTKVEEKGLDSVEQYFKEVMAIHDEVMPKMGEINRLKRTIKRALEEDQSALEATTAEKMKTALIQLEAADSLMMEWMASFNPGFEKAKKAADESIVMDFLTNERERISTVRDRMLESIKSGRELSEAIPNQE